MEKPFFLGLNSQSIVYCSIGDTSLRDFYIMSLIGKACLILARWFGKVVNYEKIDLQIAKRKIEIIVQCAQVTHQSKCYS